MVLFESRVIRPNVEKRDVSCLDEAGIWHLLSWMENKICVCIQPFVSKNVKYITARPIVSKTVRYNGLTNRLASYHDGSVSNWPRVIEKIANAECASKTTSWYFYRQAIPSICVTFGKCLTAGLG